MEEVEKSIIRRRKAELVSCLEVSKELLQELRSCGVLTPESVATIEVRIQHEFYVQVSVLFELLVTLLELVNGDLLAC